MISVRCAVDLDNVLVDIISAARRIIRKRHGARDCEIVETGCYDAPFRWANDNRPPLKLDHSFWDDDELLASCKPLPGAVEAANMLHERNLLAGYVTRRTPAGQLASALVV